VLLAKDPLALVVGSAFLQLLGGVSVPVFDRVMLFALVFESELKCLAITVEAQLRSVLSAQPVRPRGREFPLEQRLECDAGKAFAKVPGT
jgi:hypothetical protein